MPTRLRRRLRDFWRYCQHGVWGHQLYCPYPPPWWLTRPTIKEEKEDLKEHIEMLKEELKASEEELRELDEGK